ncbi:hypothetical protein MHYP_G00209300 [Metynnis hypsauchen]
MERAMRGTVQRNSKWAERRSTVVYAVRSATFGTWRMLTLGAEYSSWAWSAEASDRQKNRRSAVADLRDAAGVTEDNQTYGGLQNTAQASHYDTVTDLERPTDPKNTDIISSHEMCQEEDTLWASG